MIGKNIYITLFILSFAICQIIPYDEPLSFYSQSDEKDNIIFNSIYELPTRLNFDCDNQNICQSIIKIESSKRIIIKIYSEDTDKNDKVYIINNDNQYFQGPYYFENHTITTNPLKSKNTTIEINTSGEKNKLNLSIEILEFLPSDTDNELEFLSSTDNRENPIILVTGFWPPTNEMIRHFSQNSDLNPNGWEGDDWENRGYDIISYFPEFSDPDCSNCGIGYGDFEVDYQDTSEDFWPIFQEHSPIAVITFSRGYMDQSWELEYNAYNRTNWYNDYLTPYLPTPNPPDENEDAFFLRNSNLPMNNILNAINGLDLGLNSYIDENGDPGHFVSEFMAYHGTWYRDLNQFGDNNCITAGHIHVGGYIDWNTAKIATEESIRMVINYLDQFAYTPGDVNQDDIIDVLDLVMIINNILNMTEFSNIETLSADINQDGIINIQDVIILITVILNNRL